MKNPFGEYARSVERKCGDDERKVEMDTKEGILGLEGTVDFMCSDDYRERFIAEYAQTKIRYERLKKLNVRIEAEHLDGCPHVGFRKKCPGHLLRNQQRIMGEYLHILEIRAVIEGIEL